MAFSLLKLLKRHWGWLWAPAVVVLALTMPRNGVWTIDDGIKFIGARHASPGWHVTLPDGQFRAALREPAAYPPFHPPFAVREDGRLRLGFSPWTMALLGLAAKLGSGLLALLPALGSLLVWLLLRRWYGGNEEVIFLLPLTFYGLVLWEHSLALSVEVAALVLLFRGRRVTLLSSSLAALLLAFSALLRPEAALVVPVVFIYLWRRIGAYRALPFLLISMGLIVAGYLVSRTKGGSIIPTQVLLNFPYAAATPHSFAEALLERGSSFWTFFLSMDENIWISLGLLLLLSGGSLLIFLGEKRRALYLGILGSVALIIWIATVQFRLWTHPLPPVALLYRNSLLFACPWVLLFLFCRTKEGRPFLWAALSLALLIFLAAPVSQGVHWGPRLLLPALPLLVLAYASEKERITRHRWLWSSLVILTVFQTLSSAALVYGRKTETAERIEFLRDRVRTPLVVPSQSQVADLAPLLENVEMFTAATPSSLRRFVADARRAGAQSFWLLLPHSKEEEPMRKLTDVPMHLSEEHVFETGLFWKTTWWLGDFADIGDSAAWGAFYDDLARREIASGGLARALPEHKSAVSFAPASADYHYNYAVTLGRLGHLAEAPDELRKAIEADSLHREAKELLGRIRESPSSSP